MDKIKQSFNIENRTKYFKHTLALLGAFAVIIFIILLTNKNVLSKKEISVRKVPIDYFKDVDIEAKGAVVWDVINQRELYSKNADLPLPLASLTKVMTALIAENLLNDQSPIQIKEEYLTPEGDSGLAVGDTWQASKLRDFTLITSSNDGAFALAAASELKAKYQKGPNFNFVNEMNNLALDIGLSNTKFFNTHGLDSSVDRGGAYGSAKDMATLFEYILKEKPTLLEATKYDTLLIDSAGKGYTASNTNISVNQIPDIIASKTGYTDLAGGNLVIAYDAGVNRPIIISVLGSSQEGRFSDTLKLVTASLKYIEGD